MAKYLYIYISIFFVFFLKTRLCSNLYCENPVMAKYIYIYIYVYTRRPLVGHQKCAEILVSCLSIDSRFLDECLCMGPIGGTFSANCGGEWST